MSQQWRINKANLVSKMGLLGRISRLVGLFWRTFLQIGLPGQTLLLMFSFDYILFNWEDVLNLIKISDFTNNLKLAFKNSLVVFIFGWLDRAGCVNIGVNIVKYC